ncbi:azurin [Pelagicoccus sp. SDUM812005]|uniref:azurin n=1 Tax=Pelagicoccus sp. SDUM812005 TaxID=3041257 RepID=UPI00280FF29A|nr:azurin [Pelagicoccus sp. SDUM812005]MDQ8182228.1 azurin [Pelagicoccus sp. SDUM812005]
MNTLKTLIVSIATWLATTALSAADVQLELGSNDAMQFDKSELKAAAGSEVTLTLTHNGKLPKAAMGHNFVLLKQGTDIAAFGTKAISAAATEYIPEGKEVIAHTKLIGGGESASVTFAAPPAGTYDFICSFPGHYALMKGKFIVE